MESRFRSHSVTPPAASCSAPALVSSTGFHELHRLSEIQLERGTLWVQHTASDHPLRIVCPVGVAELMDGTLRLEFGGTNDSLEVVDGRATWAEHGLATSLLPGRPYALRALPLEASRVPVAVASVEQTITGRLVNDRNEPLSSVEVAVLCRMPGPRFPRDSTKSGADGRFSLPLRPGSHHFLDIAPSDATVGRRLALFSGPTDLGDLAISRGGALAGQVTDDDGLPVPGVDVVCRFRSDDVEGCFPAPPEGQRRVRTDADGRFEVAHVGPRYRLWAEAEGRAPLYALRGLALGNQTASELMVRLTRAATLSRKSPRHEPPPPGRGRREGLDRHRIAGDHRRSRGNRSDLPGHDHRRARLLRNRRSSVRGRIPRRGRCGTPSSERDRLDHTRGRSLAPGRDHVECLRHSLGRCPRSRGTAGCRASRRRPRPLGDPLDPALSSGGDGHPRTFPNHGDPPGETSSSPHCTTGRDRPSFGRRRRPKTCS